MVSERTCISPGRNVRAMETIYANDRDGETGYGKIIHMNQCKFYMLINFAWALSSWIELNSIHQSGLEKLILWCKVHFVCCTNISICEWISFWFKIVLLTGKFLPICINPSSILAIWRGILKLVSKYLHFNPIIFVAKSGIGWEESQCVNFAIPKTLYPMILIDWNQNF